MNGTYPFLSTLPCSDAEPQMERFRIDRSGDRPLCNFCNGSNNGPTTAHWHCSPARTLLWSPRRRGSTACVQRSAGADRQISARADNNSITSSNSSRYTDKKQSSEGCGYLHIKQALAASHRCPAGAAARSVYRFWPSRPMGAGPHAQRHMYRRRQRSGTKSRASGGRSGSKA